MSTAEIDQQLQNNVNKREAVKEKAYREERAKYEEEFQNNLGMGGSDMTLQELRKVVDSDRRMYYRTDELNDKLYIHYKGWRELKNLDGWTGLKSLYADCNAFSYIQGLHNCTKLRSLFLQDNCIKQISGLENCPDMWTINLSGNFIERIEGLENLKGLNTLIIAKNKIGFNGVADLEKLADTNICSLDIQDNRIDDPDVLPEVFARMPALRVLYLKGNSAAKKIVNYRKSLTVYCKDLRYLDDRPVFEDDRRAAEAFNRGGLEEQRAEQKLMKEEKNQKHEKNMRAFQQMIIDSRQEKKEYNAMRLEDKYTEETDPVESFERRAKRLNDKWKEEEKEELKDDARVRAEKSLRQEKEQERRELNHDEDEDEDEGDVQPATEESREAEAASGDTGAPDVLEAAEKGKKVDNRKLVYDDIWDDAPSGRGQAREPEKKPKDNHKPVYTDIWGDKLPDEVANEPRDKSSSPAGPPKSLGPAVVSGGVVKNSAGEVFMPWADGAVGMDAVAPSRDVLEKRKAVLQAKASETGESAANADAKPSWHSKYQEQMAKTQGKLDSAAPAPKAFAPPPRTAQAPAAPATEATATGTSPPMGAGELDEMD